MRDPTVNATVAAEAKRIRDAVDEGRYYLFSMFRWLRHDEKNPAAARYKYAISLLVRILNDPGADSLVRKYESAPDARGKILSALEQGRPPLRLKPGRRENTFRDLCIADIIENIRCLGFTPTRGDTAARRIRDYPLKSSIRQSACSIIAAAWRELDSEVRENRKPRRTWGFAPLKSCPKALSESSLERIWDESEWAAKLRVAKARARTKRPLRR
jgi:hypothetical protein